MVWSPQNPQKIVKKTGPEPILKTHRFFTCFFLILVSPLNCQIKIFNFRNDKPGRDNMLFVIKKRKFKKSILFNRFYNIYQLSDLNGEIGK